MSAVHTPLLVVGGGAAGFSAALEAAQQGLEVLLIEKTAGTGGSSAMSGGCLAFAGTDLQQAAGVEDSDELLRKDLLDVGRHDNDPAVVDAYLRHQLDTYRWLRGGRAISGATRTTYVTTRADRRHLITFQVTAKLSGFPTVTARSVSRRIY